MNTAALDQFAIELQEVVGAKVSCYPNIRTLREKNGLRYCPKNHGMVNVQVKMMVLAVACLAPTFLLAQGLTRDLVYFGGMGGIATLSGDGAAIITPTSE